MVSARFRSGGVGPSRQSPYGGAEPAPPGVPPPRTHNALAPLIIWPRRLPGRPCAVGEWVTHTLLRHEVRRRTERTFKEAREPRAG